MNPLTLDVSLRELVWMVEGHQEACWNHTASLRALLAPLAAFVCKEPLDPADFNPMVANKKPNRSSKNKRQSIAEMKKEMDSSKRNGGMKLTRRDR